MYKKLFIFFMVLLFPWVSFAQFDDDSDVEEVEIEVEAKAPPKTITPEQAQQMAINIIKSEKQKEEQQKLALRSKISRVGRLGLGMTFMGPGLGFGQKFDYYLTPQFNIGLGTGTTLTVPIQDKFMISYSFYGAARYHVWPNYKLSPYLAGYGGYIASSVFNDVVDYAMQWGFPDRLPHGVNQPFFSPGLGLQALAGSGFSIFVEYNYMFSENLNSQWFGMGIQVYGKGSGL